MEKDQINVVAFNGSSRKDGNTYYLTHTFQLQSYLKQLEILVNMDSGSYDIEGVNKVQDYIVALCHEWGFKSKSVSINDALLGRALEITCGTAKNGKFDILLSTHVDTVFPKGTAKKHPFAIKDIQDEEGITPIATGPGVADMKSGLLLALTLGRAIHEHYPSLSVLIAVNPCEEIGTMYSKDWLQSLGKRASCAFVFEASRKIADVIVERKATAVYKIEFEGIEAHSGNDPQLGASAVTEAAHWVTVLANLNDYPNQHSLNIAPIQGGRATTTVAGHAEFEMECRSYDKEFMDMVQKKLHDLHTHPKDSRVKTVVHLMMYMPPLIPNDATKRMFSVAQGVAESLNQRFISVPVGAGSDGNIISQYGDIPVLDGMGPSGEHYHTPQEFLRIASLEPRFHLLLKLINQLINKN